MIWTLKVGHSALYQAFPTSFTPIQTPKSVSAAVHGAYDGLDAKVALNRLTWSTNDKTVGANGVTRLASVVAPPEARLYDRSCVFELNKSPIQLSPPAVVHPGSGGLPS